MISDICAAEIVAMAPFKAFDWDQRRVRVRVRDRVRIRAGARLKLTAYAAVNLRCDSKA